jgi:signal transduction histidine kinase
MAAIGRIIRDVERASEMIQRIRSFATNEKPQMASLDVDTVINNAVALISPEACGHCVSLRLDRTPQLPPVHGDLVQLEQVVVNLALNGIEAMTSLTDRPRELVIRTRQHDAHTVLVAVQDIGIGTDSENFHRLFGAFYSTKAQGMGMGLSISRSIVEAHRGRIWAIRNSGPGMTFQFTVPTHPPVID